MHFSSFDNNTLSPPVPSRSAPQGMKKDTEKCVELGVVANVCNPSTQQAEAGESQIQPCLDYTGRPRLKKSVLKMCPYVGKWQPRPLNIKITRAHGRF
jgi:hypothetical protein